MAKEYSEWRPDADDSRGRWPWSPAVPTVYRELTRWATIWGLDMTLSDATGQYAAFNLAGPDSREVLQPLADLDLGAEAFPTWRWPREKCAG